MAVKIADGYIDIHAKLDRRDVRRTTRRAGEEAGKEFNDGFLRSLNVGKFRAAFRKLIPANLITFVPMAVAAAAAVGKLAAQIVGLTGHLLSATPAVAALVPVMGGLASSIYLLNSVISGNDALDKWLARLEGAADRAGKAVSNKLMRVLATIGPDLRAHLGDIGSAMEGMFDRLQAGFDDRGLSVKFERFLRASAGAATDLGRIMSDLVEIIVTVGAAAENVSAKFTGWLADVVEGWRDWLNEAYRTGELSDMLSRAGERLAQWGRIVRDLVGGLAGIFAAAAGPGQAMADSLERIAAAFHTWADSAKGREQVRRLLEFLAGLDVSRIFEIAASITAIGVALKTVTGLANMVHGLQMLAEMGPVAGVVAVVAAAIATLAGAFTYGYTQSEAFRGAVDRLWKLLVDEFGPAIRQFMEGFRESFMAGMQEASRAINDELVPAFETFVEQLGLALEPIGGLEGAARLLGETLGTLLAGDIRVAIENLAFLIEAVNEVVAAFNWLVEGVQEFYNGLVSDLQGAAAAGQAFAGAVGRFVSSVVSWFVIALAGVTRFTSGSTGNLTGLAGVLVRVIGVVGTLTGAILGIPKTRETVYRFFGGAFLGTIRAIGGAIRAIPKLWTTTVRRVTEFVTRGRAAGGVTGSLDKAAAGGLRRNQTLVGENGPEVVSLPTGSLVHPASNSRHMAGRGQSSEERIILELRAGEARVDRLLVELLRDAIRVRGGNVQTALGTA